MIKTKNIQYSLLVFLVSQGLYEIFINNVRLYGYRQINKINEPIEGFHFDNTEEGFDFWCGIQLKFENSYYKKYNNGKD